MDNQHTPELGRWIAPGTAEVSGPSPLDYEDEDFPITGAVCAPRRDCGHCAGLGCAECHGSGVEGFGRA